MTPKQTEQHKFCEACGQSHKAYPQNHGDQHRCGPKDWAAYQNTMLKMILAAVSASPITERDILSAQKLLKGHPEYAESSGRKP